MLRRETIAALLLLAACAHPPNEAAGNADLLVARATANVLIQALAPVEYADWGYDWSAVSVRVSRFVHWHIFEPDPRDRPPDAIVRRNGWIEGEGGDVGVSAFGVDERVTEFSVEFDRFNTLDLLAALQAEGAAVFFQADYESYSEYVIAPPGRMPGLLTARRICTPEGSRAARRCLNTASLSFA